MIKMKAKIDTPFFDQLKTVATMDGKKSMSMAINDSLKAGRTTLKREISANYNLKQKEVEKNSKIISSSPVQLKSGKIAVASRLLTVGTSTHFSITPRQYKSQEGIKVSKRKVSTATIKKQSKKKVKGAFVANPSAIKGGNTMLWIRESGKKGRGRSIQPLKTISIPQMAANKEVSKNVMETMKDTYNKRFEHHMNRSLDKVKGDG